MTSTFQTRTLIHLIPEFLAPLLDYPDELFKTRLNRLSDILKEENAGETAISLVDQLSEKLESTSLTEFQELYTSSIELGGSTNFYASVHLFGEENFKRSMLMARLVDAYQESGFSPSPHELPDFLPTLLRFASALGPGEKSVNLVHELIVPTLRAADEKITNPDQYLSLCIRLTIESLAIFMERTSND